MAANKSETTFSRNIAACSNVMAHSAGLKIGPNGTMLLSTGIPDLDSIIGGGFATGSLVVIMEDPEAPHHMLLLRNFMAQGLVHQQPLLYASPAENPKGFLGTLPNPVSSKDDKSTTRDTVQDEGLRIAWQYKKYSVEHGSESRRDGKSEYSSVFDLRKPLERHFASGRADCISLTSSADLTAFKDRCSSFLSTTPRDAANATGGRIAVQSLCSPHCEFLQEEMEMLSCIRSLKRFTRLSNSVAVVTFSPSLVSTSFSKRIQHLADTLISVKAIPDEDKDLAKLLTGYQDMVGFLSVHKVARMNTQVPVVMEATTFSMKLQKRRYLTLESLSQAPVDASSGSSYASSGCCSGSSNKGSLDF